MIDFLTNDTVWDTARVVNAVLSLVVVALLVADFVGHLDTMTVREFRSKPWVIATYCVIAYGSSEILAEGHNVSAGWRVGVLMLTLIGLTLALTSTLGPDGRRSEDKIRGSGR